MRRTAAGTGGNRKQMTATGYRRVTKKRPCGICGKPDWCSTTTTETISFCARSSVNADRISRQGWGVYYDIKSGLKFDRNSRRSPKRRRSITPVPLACPAVRDRGYSKLIELSPASSSHAIVNGRGGLRDRGLTDFSKYGNLPKTVDGRSALVDRLFDEITKDLHGGTSSFAGIPGFWMDANGGLRLWGTVDSNAELMLIPFVGADGLVQACQIRFMTYAAHRSGHYVWLSSVKQRMGSGPGSPLHHAAPRPKSHGPVLVTEGALKAATAQMFLTDKYVVGNSGVATAHREIVKTAKGRILEIAFDNDNFINPHVARALAALVRLRYEDQNSHAYEEDVRIVTWDRSIKGIDDALLAGNRLEYLSVAEWLKLLTPACLEQANRQLSPP